MRCKELLKMGFSYVVTLTDKGFLFQVLYNDNIIYEEYSNEQFENDIDDFNYICRKYILQQREDKLKELGL